MKGTHVMPNYASKPQAFITHRKQRVKQFDGQIYLNDGDEYEIELFNPTTDYILAKVKIDTQYLSGGGIVLRPGERIFLERYLDTANKFVFKIYEVGKEAVTLGAIEKNGYVKIEFHNEVIKNYYSVPFNNNYYTGTVTIGTNTLTHYGHNPMTSVTTNSTNFNPITTFTTSNSFNGGATNTAYFNNRSLTSNTIAGPEVKVSNKVETGTTEKGSYSSQQFSNSNREFSDLPFHIVVWRILPTSRKQYNKEELSIAYCGECGSKRKKDTFKFCPHCGTKF